MAEPRVVALAPADTADLVWFLQQVAELPQLEIRREAVRLLGLLGASSQPPEPTVERLTVWSAGARLWRKGAS